MKKVLLSFFLLFVFTFSISSQTPEPNATPPPLPEVDDTLVKISTTLIQLDVVVTDKKGNQITDLNPEDFEIFVNGEKQDISNFSYIFSKAANAGNTASTTTKNNKPTNKYSVPPPPAKSKLEDVRRTYAIIVDDLGLSTPSISVVKGAIRKFINEQMQPGDLVAIIRTGGGGNAFQSFTSDKRQLLASVDKIKWNGQGRGGAGGYFEAIRPDIKEDLASINTAGETAVGAETDREFENQIDEFRNVQEFNTENFSVGTLGSINYVVRGMRELPGRKAAMVFSEGFNLTSQSPTNPGRQMSTRALEAMRVLADLANRSSVVLYTLDPRGLQIPSMFNAEDRVTDIFDTGSRAVKTSEARQRDFLDSQQSLRFLAEETGGIAFINQNDLTKGLREAVEDQSGYYLIGYQPDSETFDAKGNKFNKVSIKVKRDDLRVRYRSGFFGAVDRKIENVKKTPAQQIYGALLSPFGAKDISLNLTTIFAEDDKTGTFIRSLVTIDAKDLKFSKESDGTHKANFDILAVTFGDSGAPIDETAKNYTVKLGEYAYRKILETGFIYDLLVPVKKAGAYQLRVALRDSATENVGSASQFVEIPNLKKNRLTLSTIILDNYTTDQWQKVVSGNLQNTDEQSGLDMALRRFKSGTVLRYDYMIYNAKTNPVQLNAQMRLFREGELVLEGKPVVIDGKDQANLQRIQAAGAITLGNNLAPGNYALQIIVFDNRTKGKNQVTAQWIDFEIVE